MDYLSIIENHKLWIESGGAEGARAYLSGADLREAYLNGADLKGADLTGADLTGAYLNGADLQNTKIFYFQLFQWPSFYHQGDQYEDGDYLRIGCLGYSLNYWMRNYERIGKENDFSELEIYQHFQIMMFINNHIKCA